MDLLRLAAKGFNQTYDIDYLKTSASVAKMNIVFVIFALVVIRVENCFNWMLKKFFLIVT